MKPLNMVKVQQRHSLMPTKKKHAVSVTENSQGVAFGDLYGEQSMEAGRPSVKLPTVRNRGRLSLGCQRQLVQSPKQQQRRSSTFSQVVQRDILQLLDDPDIQDLAIEELEVEESSTQTDDSDYNDGSPVDQVRLDDA